MAKRMKRERGQAFILVLILLAVGAVLIFPLLQLTSTTLKSSQMYGQFANEDYAANAALEYGLWRLNHEPGFAHSLTPGVESEPFCVTLNGVTAWTTITSYADIGEELSGQDLMKNVPYQLTKLVTPDTAEPGVETEFTYTVSLKCYDPDTPLLKKMFDKLAPGLEYVAGSTDWSEEQWGIPPFDPDEKLEKDGRYKLTWDFDPDVAFGYGEVKSMSFGAIGTLDEGIYANEVWVDPGKQDYSAFQAPITVGEPDYNSVPGGWLDINKIANPPIVYAGEPTTITYTVTAENVDIVPVKITKIEDWLPSTGVSDKDSPNVFKYVDDSTSATITLGSPFWNYKMKLTFDNSASGEDLFNFPVLVHFTSAHSDFWDHVNSSITTDDTKDLRFLDADGETHLYFEAEKIDYFAKEALIWVKVPLIDAGSTTDFIYLYYGNVAASESRYHLASKVWDSYYQGVWHLKESLTGGSGEVKDSAGVYDGTGGPTNGSYTGPNGGASGQIDGAIDFDGIDDYVDLGDIIKSPSALTVAAWYKIDALPDAYMAMVNKGDTSYALRITGEGGFANKIEFFIYDTTWRSVFSDDVSPTGTFVYAAGTWDGTDVKLYVDGTLQTDSNNASPSPMIDIIDILEFDTKKGLEPDITHVSGDVYAIAYHGDGDDGFLKTVDITSGTVIDTLEFDTAKGLEPDITHVLGDVYAIAYHGDGDDGFLKTIEIAPSGQITDTVIDTLEFDTDKGLEPDITHVSGDVYAIAYAGKDDDGFLKTVEIAPSGQITDTVIDILEFDTKKGLEPDITHVLGDVYAIAYHGDGDDGFLKTVEIASSGQITNTVIDILEFDTKKGLEPDITHVLGDVYAIAYHGDGDDGFLKTVEIASSGQITNTVIDTLEFDATQGNTPDIIHVSGDVYAIAYAGDGDDGFLKTVEIASSGQIGAYALQLGNNSQESGRNLDGILDEVRISSLARSADYIKAQYLTMTDALITYGSEEENSGSYYVVEVPMPDTYPDAKNILEKKWKDKATELRWALKWNLENHEEARFDPIFLQSGEFLVMTFQASVTLEYSGAYLNEFLVECIRYPFEVVKTVDDPPIQGKYWPPNPNTVHVNVTMENIDVEEQIIKKLKAWLPGPDTEQEVDAFSYKAETVNGYVTHTDDSTTGITIAEPDDKQNKWDNKKKRWKLEFDIPDTTLQPGEFLTVDFDAVVNPSEPKITYSELLWEIEIKDEADLKRKLYSFPTAGIICPMYNLDIDTLNSVLSANAQHGGGKIKLKSTHWEKHR